MVKVRNKNKVRELEGRSTVLSKL